MGWVSCQAPPACSKIVDCLQVGQAGSTLAVEAASKCSSCGGTGSKATGLPAAEDRAAAQLNGCLPCCQRQLMAGSGLATRFQAVNILCAC